MKILGVDPGTNTTGYAILEVINNKPKIEFSGKLSLSSIQNPYTKLQKIYNKILQIGKEYSPTILSIEAPFYGENVQSMLKLGRAQGVAIAAAVECSMDIIEYSPRKIKQAITGNGNASKEQIAGLIKAILNLNKLPDTFDETDAIATALCHFYQNNKTNINSKSYSNWSDYIKQNPKKLKK